VTTLLGTSVARTRKKLAREEAGSTLQKDIEMMKAIMVKNMLKIQRKAVIFKVTLNISDGLTINMNRYLGILELPYEKKTTKESFHYVGLLAKVSIFKSKDGMRIIHSFMGQRVIKNTNYYLAICNQYLEEKSQENQVSQAS
jgi:hypothetical protein